jgi:hypothetical protein
MMCQFLMNGLLRANKPRSCLTLYESVCADERTVPPTETVRMYITAIAATVVLRDHARALDLVVRMHRAGVRPNKKTLTAFMGTCLSSKKYEAAIDIFAKMKKPNSYAILVGLQALCHGRAFGKVLALITN